MFSAVGEKNKERAGVPSTPKKGRGY